MTTKTYPTTKPAAFFAFSFFLLVLGSCTVAYQTVPTTTNGFTFTRSPALNFAIRNGVPKHRYYYLLFYGLTGTYREIENRLNEYEAWSGEVDYFQNTAAYDRLLKRRNPAKTGALVGSVNPVRTGAGAYQTATLYPDNSIYFLQFDYNYLCSPFTEAAVNAKFAGLSQDLSKEIAANEFGAGFGWPATVSQLILDKVWEAIPTPTKASRSRYLYASQDRYYTILLSRFFTLKVDAVAKVADGGGYRYEKTGDYTMAVAWDDEGKIRQDKLSNRDGPTTRPNNLLISSSKTYLLAAFSDIQSSETLKDLPYVFLFHPLIKRDVKPTSSVGPYTRLPSDDDSPIVGNSVLLHLTSDELRTADLTKGGLPGNYVNSVFGPRNPVEVLITVTINGLPTLEPLNTRVGDLPFLPEKFKLYRKYRSGYRRVKGSLDDVILLPNDQIVYTL